MTEFTCIHRNKYIATHTETFDEFIEALEAEVQKLNRWRESGKVTLIVGGIDDDYATFVTTNAEFAEQEGFQADEDDDE